MISTNFFPNAPVPPVTSIDSCSQFTIVSFEVSFPSLASRVNAESDTSAQRPAARQTAAEHRNLLSHLLVLDSIAEEMEIETYRSRSIVTPVRAATVSPTATRQRQSQPALHCRNRSAVACFAGIV